MTEVIRTIESLFNKYRDDSLLERIKTYSQWTIPSVFPHTMHQPRVAGHNNTIEYDYQSTGALLVNRLATKLARTLFPANTSFFRIDVSDEVQQLLERQQIESIQEYENLACERLFYNASYAQLVQAMRLLVITGECLLHRVNDSIRTYSLLDYVTKRNNVGDVMEIIICEPKYFGELPVEIRAAYGDRPLDSEVKLYTRVLKRTMEGITSWLVTQEIEGKDIGTNAVYRDKLCPYIPITWNFVNGDNYGRGYVEDYACDFAKLSELSKELMVYEIEALRILHFVNPSAAVDIDTANKAPSGEYVHGDGSMIQPYEAGSYQKIQAIRADIEYIVSQLSTAFMYTGNTREGERVTAYEIRQNAEEAEQVLGGVYSQLSQHLHLPLAYLLLYEVRPDIINAIDAEEISLDIVTGIQALSRSSENQGLLIACSELNAILPVISQLGEAYNIGAIADKVFLSNGVALREIKYTPEQIQANAEARQQANQEAQMQAMTQMQPQQLSAQESAVSALQAAQSM